MRAAVRSSVLSIVAALVVTTLATPARADTATESCAEKAFDCSRGATALHAESREPVMSSIGTGWLPACATPDAQGHCGSDRPIQVSVSMDLAALPKPSTEPLWSVDMTRTAVVDARWPSTKEFELTLAPSQVLADGTFKVTHTLIPAVRVYASLLGIKVEWVYDASRFLIDYAANFAYKATSTVQFLPWAFEAPVKNVVPAPSLTTTSLLNVKLVNDSNNNVDLGLAASTTPTFVYRTTKVKLAGSTPIGPAKIAKLPMVDADYLELATDVEGEIGVSGELIAAPYVSINKIGGINVPGGLGVLDLTGPLNAPKKAYTATPPVAVKFPQVTIRIPLPNVKAPATLDVGTAQLGTNVEKAATIKNTGELGGKMSFVSSDPQFTVLASAESAPKTDYALNVRFTPAKEGRQSATITVKSNDPDQPSQTIEVSANGTAAIVPPEGAPEPEGAPAPVESGCGCRTAPRRSSWAGLGAFALLGVLALRRRR